MFQALSLIQGPLSLVYRWYLSGLIQLPMNIGMCLHPIDPVRGGDHTVNQTQTEHDISLAPTSWHTVLCTIMHKQRSKLKPDLQKHANVMLFN